MRSNTSSEAIVFVGLMPHAPILVPGVGRDHHTHVRRTLRAMADVAHRAVAAQPDAVVVISPHAPRRAGAFGIWHTPLLHGSFEQFGSDEDHVDLPLDRTFVDALEREAAARQLGTWPITDKLLDHGAAVPLAYLTGAGWKGPTAIVSLPASADSELDEFGHAIAAAADRSHHRISVIASGDMSHRLTATAPCGFHADGGVFDRAFIERLRAAGPVNLRAIDAVIADHAAQDVVDSTRIALAATDYQTPGRTVLSYEGPFGVGYGVAVLFQRPDGDNPVPASMLSHPADLPRVARTAVAAHLDESSAPPPFQAAGDLLRCQGVFVTLRGRKDQLRGCRGSPVPTQPDLVRETWQHAIESAFDDSRFPPLRADELDRVRFSVNLLGPLEPVASPSELDPALYGILVTGANGRKGLLLPGIKGIDTPADQLRLAKHKAGLKPTDHVTIQRFTAETYQEPSPQDDYD